MNSTFHDELAAYSTSLITAIGLIDNEGDELVGGTYERLSVEWTNPEPGVIRPTENLTFRVPAGSTVAGWVGYDSAGGVTEYGGADLPLEVYDAEGTYTLLAASTGIVITTS